MNAPRPDGLSSRVAQTTYRGIWVILRDWLRVPQHPPSLPLPPGGVLDSFRPAEGYLRYMTFQFLLVVFFLNGAILAAWIALVIAMPPVGLILAIPALLLALVPDVLFYIGIRLRYDTMWYVMSDRSIRLRRGIWVIQEVTITFENIQNVSVAQGPVQRYFGIADVTIQTAGGGGMGPHGTAVGGHHGIIEGINHADRLRDLILAKVKASRHAGLGDERDHHRSATEHASSVPNVTWTEERLAVLREIRDIAGSLG